MAADTVPVEFDHAAVTASVLEHARRAVTAEQHAALDVDSPLHELGLDSLARMEVVNSIEATFGIRFTEESLYDIETCRDLVACVIERLAVCHRAAPPAPALATPPTPLAESALAQHGDVRQFAECLAFAKRLQDTADAGLVNPFFRTKQSAADGSATVGDRQVVCYTSFDYLGLSTHPQVTTAARQAIDNFGTSATASRLVGGDTTLLSELDRELAEFLGVEAAVVIPSGYGTNASILGHLFGADDLILYDELAHNSIVQGSQLSRAGRRAFPHNDYAFLDRLLADVRGQHRRVVVAIEGVYSMDGDYPDLPRFVEVKRRHQALLYVDEAHSLGVLGATGRGICEHFGVDPAEGDLWMGTISKALASGGGYIGGRQSLVQYLKYTTPALVFATASSPANTAAALTALRYLRQNPQRVQRLRENAALFLSLAHANGLNTGASCDTPIVPIIVGDSARCLAISQRLLEQGIDAQPILYPAVPEAASRIRFFITAHHTPEQIRKAVEAIAECLSDAPRRTAPARPR